jgi:hypothetical protein
MEGSVGEETGLRYFMLEKLAIQAFLMKNNSAFGRITLDFKASNDTSWTSGNLFRSTPTEENVINIYEHDKSDDASPVSFHEYAHIGRISK